MSTPAEVLIYVQTIKQFFSKNDEARDYFLDGVDEELFFRQITAIAEINFTKKGDATLTQSQFEFVRAALRVFVARKEHSVEKPIQDIGKWGELFLN
jgi:hypothetical protein